MSTRARKGLALATLLSAVLVLGALVDTARRDDDHLTASIARLRAYRGRPLPDLTISTDDGRASSLTALGEGFDRLVIMFVRRGCPRCEAVLADLERREARVDPMAAVVIVEVGTAGGTGPHGPTAASPWRTAGDAGREFETVLGGRVVPVVMVVDRERTVRAVYVGEIESRSGLAWVEPAWATPEFER